MKSTIYRRPQQGFTLVETMVAITILVIAVVGPLYAVHKSLAASYAARDSLIASSLAQEGMEYLRTVRDSNYLSRSGNWLGGLSNCVVVPPEGPSDFGCNVDPNAQSVQPCASGGCTALNQDGAFRYTLAAGTPTRFSRKVTIVSISATEVEVTIAVSWKTLQVPYTITVKEHLYNWQ